MNNPLNLSGVALGTFPFSNVFGKVSAAEAEAIVQIYLECGAGYIQTSPYYEGVDNQMQGILSKLPRESYRLGTLCVKDRHSIISGKYKAVIAQCEDSLSYLGLDYIDLYLTSTPVGSDAPFSETIRAMVDLKTQGKIREIGVCNVTLAELKSYNSNGDVRYVQNRFSILDQKAERDVWEYCQQYDISLIPYNVIEWGLLTNKSLTEWILAESDLRAKVLPVFDSDPKKKIHEWVTKYLQPIAEQNNTSIEALAIHWVLSQPGVATALVGATTLNQIVSSLKASKLSGRGDIVTELNSAYNVLEEELCRDHQLSVNDYLKNSFGKW